MTNRKLPYLLNKYLNKNCSADELLEFYTMVNDPANKMEFKALLDDTITRITAEEQMDRAKQKQVLQYIFAQNEILPDEKPAIKRVKLFGSRAAAAAVLLVVGFGFYFYSNKHWLTDRQQVVAKVNDAAPGGNKATLILANGKAINLSDAKTGVVIDATKLTYNDGTSVNDPEVKVAAFDAHKQLAVRTPRGGTYHVILPDGTKVWLNAASMIKFPSIFADLKERRIELSGEAYFEVVKNKSMPFVVKTDNQEVVVLGTHFNINSYNDEESVKTTLLEGSVKVLALNVENTGKTVVANDGLLLRPGQQSIKSNTKWRVVEANIEESMAWKDGYFQFNRADIKTIMRQLARWYDIDVKYEGNVPNLKFEGNIQKNLTLAQAFKILNKSGVHFKISGKEVTVMP